MIFRNRTKAALLGLALALGCHDSTVTQAPPLDRFYYPTGITVRHEPVGCAPGTPGCQSQLIVVSSNWDVAYDANSGGTIISVDVGQALANASVPGAPSPIPAPVLGVVRIGSFGGEVAVVDAATCSTWSGPSQVLVASRSLVNLYRVDIAPSGALSCGASCVVPLDKTIADPYGITVVCGSYPASAGAAPSPTALAFITYLRANAYHGWLSRLDLLAGSPGARTSPWTSIDFGISPTGTSVFDPVSTRLYVTGRFGQANYAPIRWIELGNPAPPALVDVGPQVRGADLRGFALSSDRQRAFVAARLYDVDYATSYGLRPNIDLAGALLVLDATALTEARPAPRILGVIPLDRGVSEVRVIPRAGQRDLVAVTSSDDSTLSLYDDESGQVARTFSLCGFDPADAGAPAPCNPGAFILGSMPFGLATEKLASGRVRLYVGSFDYDWVNLIEIDPLHPAAPPSPWIRIGAERP